MTTLPCDIVVIGDSWPTYNWQPGAARSPLKISTPTAPALPFIDLVEGPSGACNGFNSGSGFWYITQAGGSVPYPDEVTGWTTNGILADRFNPVTGLTMANANFHFFARAGSTIAEVNETTGLWNDFTDARTWGQTDAAGHTPMYYLTTPPTGHAMLFIQFGGNDFLISFHFGRALLIPVDMTNRTAIQTATTAGLHHILDTVYNANKHVGVYMWSYTNMCAGETGTYPTEQYGGSPLPVQLEPTNHKGLTSLAGYPNPPGTQFCSSLLTPFLTPNAVTSVSFPPANLSSHAVSKMLWASSQMQQEWNNNDFFFAQWYAHWYADTNYGGVFSTWDTYYNLVWGSAPTSQVSTCRVGWGTQNICNKNINQQFQDTMDPVWSGVASAYTAAGFECKYINMWTSMSTFGSQVGTDNPATQSMDKTNFFDGTVHLAQASAVEFTNRAMTAWQAVANMPFLPGFVPGKTLKDHTSTFIVEHQHESGTVHVTVDSIFSQWQ